MLADVTDDMVIAREEIFGPVVTVVPVDDEDASGIGREMSWSTIEAYTEIKGVRTALG